MVYFRFFISFFNFYRSFFPVFFRTEKGRNSRCNILSVFLTTFSWFIFVFLSSFSRFYSRFFPFLSRLKKPFFLNNKKKTNSRWSLSAFVDTNGQLVQKIFKLENMSDLIAKELLTSITPESSQKRGLSDFA